MEKHYVTAIVLAAGVGSRMNSGKTKQLMELGGETLIKKTVSIFESAPSVDEIIVVARPEELELVRAELERFKKVKRIVFGGKTRAESAKAGFLAISPNCDFIAVHDAARCFTPISLVERIIADAVRYGAASVSSRVNDTVKEIDGNGFIKCTHDRSNLRFVGTPQAFSRELYERALEHSDCSDASITDDNMLLERAGISVFLTESDDFNMKITTQNDLKYAEFFLKEFGGKS